MITRRDFLKVTGVAAAADRLRWFFFHCILHRFQRRCFF